MSATGRPTCCRSADAGRCQVVPRTTRTQRPPRPSALQRRCHLPVRAVSPARRSYPAGQPPAPHRHSSPDSQQSDTISSTRRQVAQSTAGRPEIALSCRPWPWSASRSLPAAVPASAMNPMASVTGPPTYRPSSRRRGQAQQWFAWRCGCRPAVAETSSGWGGMENQLVSLRTGSEP